MGTFLGNGAKRRENFEILEEKIGSWEVISPNPGEIGTETDQLSVDP